MKYLCLIYDAEKQFETIPKAELDKFLREIERA